MSTLQLPPVSLRSSTLTPIKMQAEGHCRMCQRPAHVRPLTRHHLVYDSWFRRQPMAMRRYRNAHANIVPLCRPCHDLVHGDDDQGRVLLRRSLTQAEVAFVIAVRDRAWLEVAYPSRPTSHHGNVMTGSPPST